MPRVIVQLLKALAGGINCSPLHGRLTETLKRIVTAKEPRQHTLAHTRPT